MAITLLSTAVYDNANTNSATCDKPANTANGDIMFAVIQHGAVAPNSVPSGWTSLGQTDKVAAYGVLYYKIASSEGSNYTWGFATSDKCRIVILTYRGNINTTTPIHTSSNVNYVTNNDINRAASITTSVVNCELFFFGLFYIFGGGASQTKPSVPTSDWIEDYDTGSSVSNNSLEVCSMLWTSSGATGNIESTISIITTLKHAWAVAVNTVAIIGPANLKSYNTNLKANIKTINGNPIANVKSLNTIV